MSLSTLNSISVKELQSLCRRDNLRIGKKNKAELIITLTLKALFDAIRNYEDDELDILRLHFKVLKRHYLGSQFTRGQMLSHVYEPGHEVDNAADEDAADTADTAYDGLDNSPAITECEPLLRARPEVTELMTFVEDLKRKYEGDAALDFEGYMNEEYSHLYTYFKEGEVRKNNDLGAMGERILIHGTDENNIQSILQTDFSLTNHTRHGSAFGRGIYFTDDLELATKYSERGKNDKYFIVCIVHVGNIVRGDSRMAMLPKIPNIDRYYDTSVDNVDSPKQFVKYKNHRYNILGVLHLKITNQDSVLLKHDRRGGYRPISSASSTSSSSPTHSTISGRHQMLTGSRPKPNAKVTLINKTKVPITTYYIGKRAEDLREGKRVILSEELKAFFHFVTGEILSLAKDDCWERIRCYCIANKLHTRDSGGTRNDTYIPDQALITLLEISPTTRITEFNIQKFLEPHYIPITDDNIGYLIHHARKIITVPEKREERIHAYIGHKFISGFFTRKKSFPNNFVVVAEFKVRSFDETIVLKIP